MRARLEQVSRLVTGQSDSYQRPDFIITRNGGYFGLSHTIDLLRQITTQQLHAAAIKSAHGPTRQSRDSCASHSADRQRSPLHRLSSGSGSLQGIQRRARLPPRGPGPAARRAGAHRNAAGRGWILLATWAGTTSSSSFAAWTGRCAWRICSADCRPLSPTSTTANIAKRAGTTPSRGPERTPVSPF